jgi:mono/diheme cytochrome c family protein
MARFLPQSRLGRRILLVLALATIAVALSAAAFFRPLPTPAAPEFQGLSADAARGEYLATVGNCASCHSRAGEPAYAGGVPFRTDFGTIYSTNITSDPVAGIGGWSFADFYRAMKHGQRPDGTLLYPAFPYSYFAKLTDDDLASLYAFTRSIPAAAVEPRPNRMDFPFGDRRLMHFWNRMFHRADSFEPKPGRSSEWNRGAYLVEGPAHCGACHAPRNMLGGQSEGAELSGGVHTAAVLTGEYKLWSAPNLTPSTAGLGGWDRAQILDYLRDGHNDHVVVDGLMNEVVMNSTRHLTPRDAGAVATYLTELEPVGSGRIWPLDGSNYDLGETVYTVHCGTCHLPDGKGDPTLGVSLAGNPVVQARDPASLINVILYGPQLPPPPFVVNRTRMHPFGKRLPDEDVAAVATYLRQSFGNSASAVSDGDVEAQR